MSGGVAAANVIDVLRATAGAQPDRVALIEGSRRLTYGALMRRMDQGAAELRAAGVAPGLGPVALVCDDSLEYVEASLAVLAAGAAVTPIPVDTPEEITRALAQVDPPLVIWERAPADREGTPFLAAGSDGGSVLQLERRATRATVPSAYATCNAAFVRFSSGTTNASKGVVLSHASVLERTEAANAALRITREDTVFWVLSMTFHFVVSILLFLRAGATIVLGGRAFPESLLDQKGREEPSVLYASPFHYRRLLTDSSVSGDALASVRLAISTAMRLPVTEAARFREKFGFGLAQAYGIIEVGLPFLNDGTDPATDGAVGPPLTAYDVRIADADDGGVGEVLLRGPGLFDAYFSPWQSREQVLDDGWFRTGDLGELDGEGRLWIRGRRKAVLNFAGMKVFPEELEEVLGDCPGVREVRVFAQEHEEFGELPCAEVVLESPGATDARQIRRYAYRRLARYKVPKEIRIVEALERTPSGKVRRWTP